MYPNRWIAILILAFATTAFGNACNDPVVEDPPMETLPFLDTTENQLTLAEFAAPRTIPVPPITVPIAFGTSSRVSQKANNDFTHTGPCCQNGVDWATGGLAYAPVSGWVTRRPGNCVEDVSLDTTQACDNKCNGGWGNTVELRMQNGEVLLYGHCDSYRPEAPNGTFVLRGTPLCEIGCTGNSTGIHIHFDKVQVNDQGGRYTSLGTNYITATAGSTPNIQTPDTFEVCCWECPITPNSPNCTNYTSYSYALMDTLRTIIREIDNSDNRIVGLVGDVVPYDFSGSWTIAYQQVDANFGQGVIRTIIQLWAGSFQGNGSRNPFLDTVYSNIWDPTRQTWADNFFLINRMHTTTYNRNFINFDLYDFITTAVNVDQRNSVVFPATVTEYRNWSPVWDLWYATFTVNGNTYFAYLAIHKTTAGTRAAIYYLNGAWSSWVYL